MTVQRPRSQGRNTLQPAPTVLIIDDNRLVRESYRALLTANGFTVVEVNHGAEAILWLERNRADIIVLALAVPVLDGRSFLEHRFRRPSLRTIPVLPVSARPVAAELRQILSRLGADRLLQQPLNPTDLLTVVQETLARSTPPTAPGSEPAPEAHGRQDARISFSISLRVRTRNAAEVSGRLHDLSAGGLSVYLPHPLHREEPIIVTLDIQGRALTLPGFVRWAKERQTAMGYCHGIRFAEKQEDSFPFYAYSFFRFSHGQS